MAQEGAIEALSLIDCHTHLTYRDFDVDREIVIERAHQSNVRHIVAVSENAVDAVAVLELASRCPGVLASIGLHPVQQPESTDSPDEPARFPRCVRIEELAPVLELIRQHREQIVCIGEIGLDFSPHILLPPELASSLPAEQQAAEREQRKNAQIECFRQQVALALELDLPVNVHSRSASTAATVSASFEVRLEEGDAELMMGLAGKQAVDYLIEWGAKRVVLHAFDGRAATAAQAAKAGYVHGARAIHSGNTPSHSNTHSSRITLPQILLVDPTIDHAKRSTAQAAECATDGLFTAGTSRS